MIWALNSGKRHCPRHCPLMTIFSKPILTSPKCLQRMRLWLQKYPLKVSYKPGPQMFTRDTLSGVALPLRHAKPDSPEFLIFQVSREESFCKEVEETNLCKESLYKPEVQSAVTAQVMCKRQLAKDALPWPKCQTATYSLVIGQPVQVKAQPQQPHSDWKPGVILENLAPWSYLVEVNGHTYCRHSVHLRDAVQSQTDSLPVQEPDPAQTPGLFENKPANNDHDPASNQPLLRKVPATPTSSNTVTPPASSNVTQTRSGWIYCQAQQPV